MSFLALGNHYLNLKKLITKEIIMTEELARTRDFQLYTKLERIRNMVEQMEISSNKFI